MKATLAAVHAALEGVIPADAVMGVYGRDAVAALLTMHGTIDLVIPRGSNSLVQHIQQNTLIPVLGHADGVCHVYVDAAADSAMAVAIAVDSKVQYPAACNAAETILVHDGIAESFLPSLRNRSLQRVLTSKAVKPPERYWLISQSMQSQMRNGIRSF